MDGSARTNTVALKTSQGPFWVNRSGPATLAGGKMPKDSLKVTGPYHRAVYRQRLRNHPPAVDEAIQIKLGQRVRNEEERNTALENLTHAEQEALFTYGYDRQEALFEQRDAHRTPARPFEQGHANRMTKFEKRNPGKEKFIEPVQNPRAQERMGLAGSLPPEVQSARFLPPELLHMIRPNKQAQQTLPPDHPRYNNGPAQQIRQYLAEPPPRSYHS